MSQKPSSEDFGKPALRIAGFQLWIHGREFSEADDYDDGNWLRVTAHCGGSGASVWAQGSIVMIMDIDGFGRQCAAMLRGDSSSAVLDPFEPELKVSLEAADHVGHIRVQVEITPDYLAQYHKMQFEIDQSYLARIVQQCAAIVQEHPIRGDKDRKSV